MNVIPDLAREHKIFAALIDRLERSPAYNEKTMRGEVRDVLLVLLPALDLHEQIEETVFGHPAYAAKEDAKHLLGETEYEHRQIQALQEELIEALALDSQTPIAPLKSLVVRIATKLRLHFETEEKRLWPHYRAFSRSLDQSVKRRVEEQVKALGKDVEKRLVAVADYLSIRR